MKVAMFPRTILLTGATGVLGGRILKELLESTAAQVYCLVRGDDVSQCEARARAFLRLYDKDGALEPQFHSRVTVLRGDVTEEQLGLPTPVYAQVQSLIELTIHAAANTSLLAKYARLAPVNVHGTGRVIEFCLGTAGKALAYISTYTVMGDKTFDKQARFCEADYELGQGFDHMSYQRSKFLAEGMVRVAGDQGLKWRIFRPGQIYGDSVTGAYPHAETQVTGLFYDLFRTAMDTRVMPESYIQFDVVPVDYVARGIVALCAGADSLFQAYHLINPDSKTFAQVMTLLRETGYEIELLPEETYKRRLRSGQITCDGRPYSSAMLKAFSRWYFVAKVSFHDSATTGCEYTRAALEKLGVTCARLDQRLIETYVRTGIHEGYFPPPTHARNIDPQRKAARPSEDLLPGSAAVGAFLK